MKTNYYIEKFKPLLPENVIRAKGSVKLNYLLGIEKIGELVGNLDSFDFYALIKEIGVHDSLELIQYASPEQMQNLLDLDAWSGGSINPDRFFKWFDIAHQIGYEKAVEFIRAIDPEILILFFLKRSRIRYLTDEEKETGEIPDGSIRTPDNIYIIEMEDPSAHFHELNSVIDYLYAADLELAHRILDTAICELPSFTEEELLRLRQGRLIDMGFPAEESRYEIFQKIHLSEIRKFIKELSGKNHKGPGLEPVYMVLDVLPEGNFLHKVIEKIEEEHELKKFLEDFSFLVKRIMITLTEDLSDENILKIATEYGSSTISLGLQYLSGNNAGEGKIILMSLFMNNIFQTGNNLILNLQEKSRKFTGKLMEIQTGGLQALPSYISMPVQGLKIFPAMFYEGLENNVLNGYRYFSSLNDVNLTSISIKKGSVLTEYFSGVFSFKAPVNHGFSSMLNTILIHQILHGKPSLDPLSGNEISQFVSIAFSGKKLFSKVREQAEVETENFSKNDEEKQFLREFFLDSLGRLEEALSGLDPSSPPEVRFLGDILIFKSQF
jgi:hypothetical protein